MILDAQQWMDVRRFRALHEAGVSLSAIARETGHDWRTVKKYLAESGSLPPEAPTRRGSQPRLVDQFAELIDEWLRADVGLKGRVIHERLATEYGFTGHYQRVKMYLQEARPRIRREMGLEPGLSGLHRRFEVVAGAQAQVDWGDEGDVLAHVGVPRVYSFHMVLSYSRDPFTCFTTSLDLGTFWECHRRAFAHFHGVPASVVYDRTKTVVRRHVAPGKAVPVHPEAVAFAGHYGFDIDVLAAYRPTGKGRVERQVDIVRAHVVAGRRFDCLAAMDEAFLAWLPIRRREVHRTHGEVIGYRAVADHAALRPLPSRPYLVAERHLRRVGKDCLVSFEASLYSVPARLIQPGQQVEVRVTPDTVTICRLGTTTSGDVLAVHHRARQRGTWTVENSHWDGLPDGTGRRVTTGDEPGEDGSGQIAIPAARGPANPLDALITRAAAARVAVGRRPLSIYDDLAGLQGVNF